jgi:hypothetical protein
MEPVTLAGTVAALFFSEMLKEGGKALGKSISDLAGKFIHTIRAKFQDAGTEGLLTRAEHDPSPKNLEKVQDELATQMAEDDSYAAQLQDLVAQLAAHEAVRQVMASGLKVKTLEAQSMTQRAADGTDVEQHMLTDVQVKNIKIGEMKQEA